MSLKVYLAGGFKSDWQSKVMDAVVGNVIFFNPKSHQLKDPKQYTLWDLEAIKNCDYVLAYLEADNPGRGVLLEIGYAKGLGKQVIFVNESGDKYTAIAEAAADAVCADLNESINLLTRVQVFYTKDDNERFDRT